MNNGLLYNIFYYLSMDDLDMSIDFNDNIFITNEEREQYTNDTFSSRHDPDSDYIIDTDYDSDTDSDTD